MLLYAQGLGPCCTPSGSELKELPKNFAGLSTLIPLLFIIIDSPRVNLHFRGRYIPEVAIFRVTMYCKRYHRNSNGPKWKLD
jgi:hypothetical protein